MLRTLVRSSLCLLTVLAAGVRANTYVVGTGPGADFADIPTAIAAAEPGDVLLVQAGTYSGFVLDKGLTILGTGLVQLLTTSQIQSVPIGQQAVVVNLRCFSAGIQISQCAGPVVLQEMLIYGAMTVADSSDVRCLSITVSPSPNPRPAAVWISGSRVEFVDSSIQGTGHAASGDGIPGDPGLSCAPGCRVHMARCDVRGGNGVPNATPDVSAGDGAPGIVTAPDSELLISGGGSSIVTAGDWGVNMNPNGEDCCWYGQSTTSVRNEGPVWFSGVTFFPGALHYTTPIAHTCCGTYYRFPDHEGGGAWIEDDSLDPTLSISGTPTNGGSVTLTIRGAVGASARLVLGRRLALVSSPSVQVEELVEPLWSLDLGTIPANGEVSYVFGMPGLAGTARYLHLPPGAFFAAQGIVPESNGRIRRTNSIPIVGR